MSEGGLAGAQEAAQAEQQIRAHRVLFEQLDHLGFERGKGVTSITVAVLMILRSYNDRKKLEALGKLSGQEEGFDVRTLHLKVRRSQLPLLERAHEAGEGGPRRRCSTGSWRWGGRTPI